MEITQKEINVLANKAGRISTLLQEVNTMAFELAKAGNASGVFQLRGAFSGTLQAAKMTDGFLSGLVGVIDRLIKVSHLGGNAEGGTQKKGTRRWQRF